MTFAEAVSRFGSDRPDTRFGLELQDLGEPLAATEFKVFAGVLEGGGVVRGINAGPRDLARSDLDELTDLAKQHGAKGLVWAFIEEGNGWRSPIAKFLRPEELVAINSRLEANPGDLLLIVADEATTAGDALSALRLEIARRFDLIDRSRHDILWVVEFPAFFWDPQAKRWDAAHHPFTAPKGSFDDPGALLSRSYDLVLDGSEIGGGSIRIHRREVQEQVFGLLGLGRGGTGRFGFLLDALRYGAPPHGGIALGTGPGRGRARRTRIDPGRDRLPQGGQRHRSAHGAPAPVDPAQLREVGIRGVSAGPGREARRSESAPPEPGGATTRALMLGRGTVDWPYA